MSPTAGVVANALILGTLAYAALLNAYLPDLYHSAVQEDEYLEWSTFWAFALASGLWLLAALRQRRLARLTPWFFAGIAAFCFVVAMEEISWGQRILGYRPPPYFLANNFQQELNFHNVVDTDMRKLAFQAILCGYGVALPLLAWVPALRRWLAALAIEAPPAALAPAFTAMAAAAISYPLEYTGEIVELMMGQGFLFAALSSAGIHRRSRAATRRGVSAPTLVGSWVVIVLLGLGNAAAARHGRSHDPHAVQAATLELEALKQDFIAMSSVADEEFPTWRSLDKRVYSYEKKYGHGYLYSGRLAKLVASGLPEERAHFFLDPWNAPYWINLEWSSDRDRCTAFVYSFGPNRRRESTHTEIRGDDVAAFIYADEPVSPR